MAVTREDDLPTPTIDTTTVADRSGTRVVSVRTPWWRRITALVSLGSLVVIAGVLLAAFMAVGVLLLLMFLERAAN